MTDLRSELLSSEREVEPLKQRWRELADAADSPFMGPEWALAWWRNAAPQGARLTVGVVTEGDQVIGLAPRFVAGRAWRRVRMLGAGCGRDLSPLAVQGREREVAEGLATAGLFTAAGKGTWMELEWVSVSSPWPSALAEHSRGPAPSMLLEHPSTPCPVIDLTSGDFEAWYASRSRNYRQEAEAMSAALGRGGSRDSPRPARGRPRSRRGTNPAESAALEEPGTPSHDHATDGRPAARRG